MELATMRTGSFPYYKILTKSSHGSHMGFLWQRANDVDKQVPFTYRQPISQVKPTIISQHTTT